jgi:hypothetical protein
VTRKQPRTKRIQWQGYNTRILNEFSRDMPTGCEWEDRDEMSPESQLQEYGPRVYRDTAGAEWAYQMLRRWEMMG